MAFSSRNRPRRRRVWLPLLLGLLIAGLLVGGAVAWRIARDYRERAERFDLSQLRQMESASQILDRRKNVLGRIYIQNREPIPLDRVPQVMIQAVIAAEDNRFYRHRGIDYVGIARAALKNYRAGRIRQGAGTLTMQLARNTFDLRDRSYDRKLLEVFLARRIEANFSKAEILELYLNRVYYGSGFFGVEAAARGYFGKPAANLNLSESATLAGLLKSPNNFSPWSDRKACIEQRDYVLKRMLEEGMIDAAQYEAAVASELAVKNRVALNAQSYALDQVRQQVISQLGFENADIQGLRIHTTLDSGLQQVAEVALEERLVKMEARPDWEHPRRSQYAALLQTATKTGQKPPVPEYLQGAVLAVDNATGGILALVGGRDFEESQYNRALSARRPAGTAFLPIVYAAAFESGLYPGTLVQDTPIDNRQVMIGGTTGVLGEWGPERADNRFEGPIPARQALVKSKNAATVRLGNQVGLEKVIATAKQLGISSPLRPFPATFLGSSEVTLEEMVVAFTAFPGGGQRPAAPYLIQRIEDGSGKLVYAHKPERVASLRETTAFEIHSCLAESLESGTADRAFTQYGLRRLPLEGKTGTAYNFTDAWFVGYSRSITCGVWIGFDKPRTTIHRGAFSNETALPVWVRIMNAAADWFLTPEIPRPEGLQRIEVCLTSGLPATERCFEETVDPGSGAKIQRRSTYFEFADREHVPAGTCDIHGGTGVLVAANTAGGEREWPRAQAAFDASSTQVVGLKGPTVIGEDPYGTVTPQSFAESTAQMQSALGMVPVAQPANGEPEVRRAEPVRPFDQPIENPAMRLPPPQPMEFW